MSKPVSAGGAGGEAASGASRRSFLRGAAATAGLSVWAGCLGNGTSAFGRKRLKELSRSELAALLKELDREMERRFERDDIQVHSTPPQEGVLFGYALDLSRCVGCRRCVKACVEENNQSRPSDTGRHDNPIEWIKVFQLEKEHGVDLAHGDAYYAPEQVPAEGHFYVPVACQQCKNPPCVKVCPTGATWKERDGIVVIDYDWCIGCRYCMVACPYGARRFNWAKPNLTADAINPNMHVLGNRPREKGVVEKCTLCIQRVRAGRYPACVEVCPVGARKFGNLLDPESEIRYVLEHKRVLVLKEELRTIPQFYYFYGT